jgi:hypothetical protein
MKPENVAIVDGKLMIIDSDITFLYKIPPGFIEYFKQAAKLIALYTMVGLENTTVAEASGLSLIDLKKLFNMGTQYLRKGDLSIEQKRHLTILNLDRLGPAPRPRLQFPMSVIDHYAKQATKLIKIAEKRKVAAEPRHSYLRKVTFGSRNGARTRSINGNVNRNRTRSINGNVNRNEGQSKRARYNNLPSIYESPETHDEKLRYVEY